MKKILVAYFSASGTTKKTAELLAKATGADLFEIQPEEPYTAADLDWTNKKSRSTLEMNDPASRPGIVSRVENMADYATVFLGFPIWWYTAPTIIKTFLESYDFSGKKIILFATSGGSGFGRTREDISKSVGESTSVVEGKILNGVYTAAELKAWSEKFVK